jgi:hypothetical protein
VDKHSNATDETEFERLPEEVQAMLGDKDTLVNAIQVGLYAVAQAYGTAFGQLSGDCA